MSQHSTRRFLVLFTTRSGSTYIIDGLRTHSEIYAEYENLVALKPLGAQGQIEGVSRFYHHFASYGYSAIGFKAKLRDVVDPAGFQRLLRDLEVSIIHLDRRNSVKLVVSLLLGERLFAASGQWNIYSSDDRSPSIVIDIDRFERLLQTALTERRQLQDYVARLGLPSLSLSYEELLTSFSTSAERIMDFLSCSRQILQPRTQKHGSDDLRRVIVNFDELHDRYAGTIYAEMLDEVL